MEEGTKEELYPKLKNSVFIILVCSQEMITKHNYHDYARSLTSIKKVIPTKHKVAEVNNITAIIWLS